MTKTPTIPNDFASPTPEDGREARQIARGVLRLLAAHDIAAMLELTLPGGRRADVAGLSPSGKILIAEVKSSVADFRADHKWHEYRAYCDELYFAVAGSFPFELLPSDAGLIVADRYGGDFVRAPAQHPLAAARRKAMTLRMARTAASRLALANDPSLHELT